MLHSRTMTFTLPVGDGRCVAPRRSSTHTHDTRATGGVCIGLGIVIFLVGFLGWFGAIRERSGMLRAYASLVLIFFIIEVAMAILIVVYRSKLEDMISSAWNPKNSDVTSAIDEVQQTVRRRQCRDLCLAALTFSATVPLLRPQQLDRVHQGGNADPGELPPEPGYQPAHFHRGLSGRVQQLDRLARKHHHRHCVGHCGHPDLDCVCIVLPCGGDQARGLVREHRVVVVMSWDLSCFHAF
jgi:hypothetical protein